MADHIGVYGCGARADGDHPAHCGCRICFTIGLKERINEAVEFDKRGIMDKATVEEIRKKVISLKVSAQTISQEMKGDSSGFYDGIVAGYNTLLTTLNDASHEPRPPLTLKGKACDDDDKRKVL